MQFSSRRQFLCQMAGAGSALAFGITEWQRLLAAEAGAAPSGLQVFSRNGWALGSDVKITVLAAEAKLAGRAIAAAFDELDVVEQQMSLYRADSQLCRLNRDGFLERPHPYLVEVLQCATEVSERTDGAFDVTVQPLWALFAASKAKGRLPTTAEIDRVRQAVDWRQVEASPTQVRLRGKGTAITLNGIAQGFATDRATAAIRSHGIDHALIQAGEIGALGHKQDGDAWTVGIQHPREPDAYVSLAKLSNRCLATSGDYATRFSDDYLHHHIFDPATGRSPQALASVSIAAASGMQADALSTAAFVLGPQRGLDLVRATPGADALLVLKDGLILMTDGFPTAES